VPPGYRGTKPVPLVLDLHGHTEPAALHKINSGLGTFGDHHGFVTVTPEGSGPPPQWDTTFRSADMRFLGEVLDEVEQALCIDERRVFVAGYSNGAFMASAMVCVYPDRIAAVGAVAGIRAVPGCTPRRPVPVVAFHGTADPFVSFNGGLGPGVNNLPAADRQALIDVAAPTDSRLSVPQVTRAWAIRNGCGSKPTTRSVAKDVALVRYPCPTDADVELYRIDRGGHTWPGSQFSKSIAPFVGRTTFSIDADQLMWAFFQQHPRRSGP
jgi:polyhydroxybutyrate depolymerase